MLNNKDPAFIEERRYLLQEFMVNVCRHDYLWYSEEFEGFVRSTPDHDLLPNLKEKIKFENGKHVQEGVTIEHDILERIYRYDRIFKQLTNKNAEVKKFSTRSTD